MATVKNTRDKIVSEDVEKKSPGVLLIGNQIGTSTMDNNIEVHQKLKNKLP